MNPREKADIVERLLKSAAAGDVPYYRDDSNNVVFHADNMEEAATEIASLRRELEEARAALRRCVRVFDMLVEPTVVSGSTVMAAFATVTETRAAIRNLAGEKADG